MTNRNVKFVLILFCVLMFIGFLVDWRIVAGLLFGVALTVYVYQRRYNIIDEIETDIYWYAQNGWKDYEDEEDPNPNWHDSWRFVFVIFLVIVLSVATLIGLVIS